MLYLKREFGKAYRAVNIFPTFSVYLTDSQSSNGVMVLITCEVKLVETVSSMQKENKLTSANWNVIFFILASAFKCIHLTKNLRIRTQLSQVKQRFVRIKEKCLDSKIGRYGKSYFEI